MSYMESSEVVVDASLVGLWVLSDPWSTTADALSARWTRAGTVVIAPYLMLAELTNALYKRVRRGELRLEEALDALQIVDSVGIRLEEEPDLHARALVLAHQLNLPASYDAHYVALAEQFGCELWTGDERLFNSVRSQLPWVRWVGTYPHRSGRD